MHSCYSDGALTPAQLVRKFVDEEYDIIALTDHDGIGGVKEFLAACEAAKVQGVAGVEFSTSHEFKGKNLEIHLLGYRFDPDRISRARPDTGHHRHDRQHRIQVEARRIHRRAVR